MSHRFDIFLALNARKLNCLCAGWQMCFEAEGPDVLSMGLEVSPALEAE
jgi:hypothetical protein